MNFGRRVGEAWGRGKKKTAGGTRWIGTVLIRQNLQLALQWGEP